jgi:hypothetical protein
MMFMNNAPPSIVLAESHRETEFEFDSLAAAEIAAATDGSCECNVFAGGYFHVMKIEFDRLGLPCKERSPSLHIGAQPARQEWRRYIEHQYVRVMVFADSIQVFVAHGL